MRLVYVIFFLLLVSNGYTSSSELVLVGLGTPTDIAQQRIIAGAAGSLCGMQDSYCVEIDGKKYLLSADEGVFTYSDLSEYEETTAYCKSTWNKKTITCRNFGDITEWNYFENPVISGVTRGNSLFWNFNGYIFTVADPTNMDYISDGAAVLDSSLQAYEDAWPNPVFYGDVKEWDGRYLGNKPSGSLDRARYVLRRLIEDEVMCEQGTDTRGDDKDNCYGYIEPDYDYKCDVDHGGNSYADDSDGDCEQFVYYVAKAKEDEPGKISFRPTNLELYTGISEDLHEEFQSDLKEQLSSYVARNDDYLIYDYGNLDLYERVPSVATTTKLPENYGSWGGCSDGVDNDGDGHIDCQDDDCWGQEGPEGHMCQEFETFCGDGMDNDGNGLIDCLDPYCDLSIRDDIDGSGGTSNWLTAANTFELPEDAMTGHRAMEGVSIGDSTNHCEYQTERTCNDGLDNDADGLTDCADGDCNLMACDGGYICQSGQCVESVPEDVSFGSMKNYDEYYTGNFYADVLNWIHDMAYHADDCGVDYEIYGDLYASGILGHRICVPGLE